MKQLYPTRFLPVIFLFLIALCSTVTKAQCTWQQGDFITYTQEGWDQSVGATLLSSNFISVYGAQVTVGSTFTMSFTNAAAVFSYIPATGTTSSLNASVVNPLTTSSGALGGEVLALQFNVDFYDEGLLSGSQTTAFGDLVISNFTDIPTVNGLTVRQFLASASNVLGGGSDIFSVGTAQVVAGLLNNAFVNGTPSQFAIDHLIDPGCIDSTNCPTTNPLSFTTEVNVALTFAFEDDDQLTGWTYAIVQNGAHGTAGMDNATVGYYDPEFGFSGFDFFVYSVTNDTCTLLDTVFVTVVCTPQQGDFITYTQNGWDSGSGATLLAGSFTSVFDFGVTIGSQNTTIFSNPSAIFSYLPAVGSPAAFSGNSLNPMTTSAGELSGQILALQLNVTLNDSGFLSGSASTRFGDLVIYDFDPFPIVNGMTVRQILASANTVVGGVADVITPSTALTMTSLLNNAFVNGTPSQFAIDHLLNPDCAPNECPVTNPLTVTVGSGVTETFALGASDPDGNSELSYIITQQPAHGTLDSDGDGGVSYTSSVGFTGADFFVYTVTDAFCNVTDTVFIVVECLSVGDAGFVTYSQIAWGDGSSEAGILLTSEFTNVFGGNLEVGSTYIIALGSSSAVFNFLPAIGTASTLSANVLNPLTTSSGELGGQVVALQINVEMSDSGVLGGAARLGDLVFHDFTDLPALNGYSIRQFLDTANYVLGGGSGSQFGPTTVEAVARRINGLFLDGVPSDFALESVMFPCQVGTNNCPTTNPSLVTTTPNTEVEVPLNFSDSDGDLLTVNITQNPTNGTLFIDGDGGIYYTPNTGFTGPDFFVFSASDSSCTVEDTAFITVECPAIADAGSVTYNQTDWGSSLTDANELLNSEFANVFGSALVVGGTHTITLTSAFAIDNLLPTVGSAGSLQGSSQNPMTTSAGEFAGEIIALQINVEFSDSGLLSGAVPFGDLVFHDFTDLPILNGQSVRGFLSNANYLLGGGIGVPYGASTAAAVARRLNESFENGVPSDFALESLMIPCDTLALTNNCPSFATGHDTIPYGGTLGNDLLFLTSDPDNDSLSYIAVAQQGATTVTNGVLLYEPNAGFTGTDTILVTVSDGVCEIVDTLFVTVQPDATHDAAPLFVSPTPSCGSIIQGTVGNALSFTVHAQDANGDVVTLNGSNLPFGAVTTPSLPLTGTNPSTVVTWTPTSTGSYTLMFTASDGESQTSCGIIVSVPACGSCGN